MEYGFIAVPQSLVNVHPSVGYNNYFNSLHNWQVVIPDLSQARAVRHCMHVCMHVCLLDVA